MKPNIVFILADDLSYWDLSCFGQAKFSTPNIDRLAAEGVVFSNAYAAAPWCAPSRTGLMTGLNCTHHAPFSKDRFRPTVAEALKGADYTTCALGKWHMNEGDYHSWLNAPTWKELKEKTNWQQLPWNRGFDVCRIGYRSGFQGTNGNPYWPHLIETGDNEEIPFPENHDIDTDTLWKYNVPERYDDQGRFLDKNGRNSTQLRYSEDYYREEAVAFMRENRHGPFYMHYATPLVHGPLNVKQMGTFEDTTGWSLAHKMWATMVQEVDKTVGTLVDEIKALGIEQNTIFIFSSDNGYSQWGYFRQAYPDRQPWSDDPIFRNKGPWNRGKFATTNGGVIVPFIAWGAGRVAQGRTDRAVNFYDFMATAAELAGAELPGPTDGVSFVPLLEGREGDQPLRESMLWPGTSGRMATRRFCDDWAPEEADRIQLVEMPDAALLDEKWFAMDINGTVRLFDVSTDPGMERDVAEGHQDLVERAETLFAGT